MITLRMMVAPVDYVIVFYCGVRFMLFRSDVCLINFFYNKLQEGGKILSLK